MKLKLTLFTTLAWFLSQPVLAETPPNGFIPLSEIIAGLEQRGLSRIERIKMNHEQWEIIIKQDKGSVELRIDAMTGQITGQKQH